MDIILFGTGYIGQNLYHFLLEYDMTIQFWIDSDISKQGKKLLGLSIYGPEKLKGLKKEYVCISAKDTGNSIYDCVLSCGVPKDRILSYTELIIGVLNQKLPEMESNDINMISKYNKVIFDCTKGLGLGGVEEWSMSLLEPMKPIGYDAFIISPLGKYQIPEMVREKVLFVDIDSEAVFSRHNMEQIYDILQKYCPCTIISKSIDDLAMVSCVIKKRNPCAIRLISVIHQGLDAVYKENQDIDEYVDRYVSVSKDIQSGMIGLGIAADKVLHTTCPVWCPERLCRDYTMDEREPIRIGYAGRLEQPQKRMDLLLKLLCELEKLQCSYQFELAGDGKYTEKIRKFIYSRCLEEKVKLLGKLDRSDIPAFWGRQDICVNIADHEGRSLSIMEAMANGAVPVVTATSGVREDINDSINGFVVDLGDYEAMAGKIHHLCHNRYLLNHMGSKAHEVIMQKSDMGTHMEFWSRVLGGLWEEE